MSENLHQIIYLSTAEPTLTEETLLELLTESQKRNAEHGITGLLLHSDNNIIQIIEGPESATKRLYKNIAADPRHRAVTLMSSKAIEQRDFPEFKMGFKRTCNEDLSEQLPYFSKIVDNKKLPPEKLEGMSKLVRIMLKTFARTTHMDRSGHDKLS